jgi:hypothetical protein
MAANRISQKPDERPRRQLRQEDDVMFRHESNTRIRGKCQIRQESATSPTEALTSDPAITRDLIQQLAFWPPAEELGRMAVGCQSSGQVTDESLDPADRWESTSIEQQFHRQKPFGVHLRSGSFRPLSRGDNLMRSNEL